MLIKVCGLTIDEQVKQISGVSDFVGFIHYSKSLRFIPISPTSNGAKRVGVFVNEAPEKITEIILRDALDVVQLHGDETPKNCSELQQHAIVFKAFGMSDQFNFSSLLDYEGCVDYFLFDTKTKNYGGSGRQFSWDILNRYNLSTPFLLSGGITPDSISQIKQIKHPQFVGVDINSGFEISPGNKNISQIKQFIDALKNN